MKPLPLVQTWLFGMFADAESIRYGLQLAASVALAYLVSYALALPEGFWAVMSALIVMRARTGSTLGEGWGRVKGTLVGALFGLFGVWLHSVGVATAVVTLGIIASLAFIGGVAPSLRSAPITALIILADGAVAGHSPWQLAGLRVAEIAIGIGAGLAVSFLTPSSRSVPHFDRSLRSLLAFIDEQTQCSLTIDAWSARDRETANRQMKLRLGRLALLAASAETERRFFIAKAGHLQAGQEYRRRAGLVSRIAQDAALFGRIFESMPGRQGDPIWDTVSGAISAALAHTMAASTSSALLDESLRALSDCIRSEAGFDDDLKYMLTAPITLLAGDIQSLARAQGR